MFEGESFGYDSYGAYGNGVPPDEGPPSSTVATKFPFVPGAIQRQPPARPPVVATSASWWQRRTTIEKVGIVGGGVAVLGVVAYMLVGGRKTATPNRRA